MYLIGGTGLTTVSRFHVTKRKWEVMPQLNQTRIAAPGCFIGEKIYLIGGAVAGRVINSFEMLSVNALENGWKLIQPTELELAPVNQHIVGVLN